MANQARVENVYRIGISGSYGGLNLATRRSSRPSWCSSAPAVPCEITVFSHDAKDTVARPEVAGLDLLILGGGGIVYDEAADVQTELRRQGALI